MYTRMNVEGDPCGQRKIYSRIFRKKLSKTKRNLSQDSWPPDGEFPNTKQKCDVWHTDTASGIEN
jgi:hypothetical protein